MIIKQKLQTPNKSKGTNTREFIVLHHTATEEGTIRGVLNAFTGARQVSCHYVVDTNGDIYQIGEETDILRHCDPSSWQGRRSMNPYAIGIEVIGPLSDGGFTNQQKKATWDLIEDIMQRNRITPDRLLRHADITTRKRDIAPSFYAPLSWKGYQDTFIFQNRMTQEQYNLFIRGQMAGHSLQHQLASQYIEDPKVREEIQRLLARLNELYRQQKIGQ